MTRSSKGISGGRSKAGLAYVTMFSVVVAVLTIPTGTADVADEWLVVEDPRGDPFLLTRSGEDLDMNPFGTLYQHADIVEVRVGGETPDSFDLWTTFASREDPYTLVAESLSPWNLVCSFDFTFNDRERSLYNVRFGAWNVRDTAGEGRLWAALNGFHESSDGTYWSPFGAPLPVAWDDANLTMKVTVPKSLALPWHNSYAAKGVTVTLLEGDCESGNVPEARDRILPVGAKVAFHEPGNMEQLYVHVGENAPGTPLTLTWEDDETGFLPHEVAPFGVVPGQALRVPVTVQNNERAPVTVDLESAVVRGHRGLSEWQVEPTPALRLGPGENATTWVSVRPPATIGYDQQGTVLVTADSGSRIARGAAPVVTVPPVSPTENRIHFFARQVPDDPLLEGAGNPVDTDLAFSVLESLEGWDQEPILASQWACFYGNWGPLPYSVRVAGEYELQIAFKGGVDGTRVLTHFESRGADMIEWDGNASAGTPEAVRVPVNDLTVLPERTIIGFQVCFWPTGGAVSFDPANSYLDLPIVEVITPEPNEAAPTVGDERGAPGLTFGVTLVACLLCARRVARGGFPA